MAREPLSPPLGRSYIRCMNTVTARAINWTESGLVPDSVIRSAIRRLLDRKIDEIGADDPEAAADTLNAFVEMMRASPVALVPELANAQHYELPSEYFELLLAAFPDLRMDVEDLLVDGDRAGAVAQGGSVVCFLPGSVRFCLQEQGCADASGRCCGLPAVSAGSAGHQGYRSEDRRRNGSQVVRRRADVPAGLQDYG